MNCRSCGFENPDGMKFCGSCGASLTPTCPRCGFENPLGFKFCGGCGAGLGDQVTCEPPSAARDPRSYTPKHLAEKILTSRSVLEGERKQVTVLFADVQGSVALSQGVDAETLHKIMDRFFAILSEGVHRFEGTINQYTGDGIMALFGAPIAHEDHARRACYSALHLGEYLSRYAQELKREHGLTFSVRMGLNSGEVVVGKIGDDLRMDYTAQGHTVGLASRIEALASPDTVYLAESTAKLVAGFFDVKDLGHFNVKGVREPVTVYQLRGVGKLRTRLEVSQARGFSRFVGRSHEMQVLETALAQALDGHGQVVGVVGEAGIGKSRLCLEFVDRLSARGTSVYEAHCPAHGKTLPFVAVLELFRTYFGITEQDDDAEARKKIAGTLLLLDEQFREVLPLVFDFLGVPDPQRPVQRMDPEARQRQLFSFLRQLVERRSAHEPGVLLLDDAHWIDLGSDAFLAQLVEAVNGTRTLLLVNFRPEYDAPWMARSYYQQMPLLPLTPQGAEELLADLLGCDPSLVGLADRIGERTGGNPFFIEEVVQSLVESGSLMGTPGAYQLAQPVEALAMPATVQVVLAARIDRLGERGKQTLQTASVIGRTFSEPILTGVAGQSRTELTAALSSLQRAEFIYEEALYPEAVYAFKHALTQEVAYHSQLTETRTRVHAAVARTIAELHSDRLDEQAALIAHHWEEAGEALEAARWHSRAGTWAGTSNLAEALRHWRKVSALLERVPESPETTALGVMARIQILNVGWRLGASSEEEAAVTFAEGKALAERSGDMSALALIIAVYASVAGLAGDARAYISYGMEAVRVADQTDNLGLRVGCRSILTVGHWFAGHLAEALSFAEEQLIETHEDPKLGADILGFNLHAHALMFRASIVSAMGRHEEARENIDRALQIARQHSDAEVLSASHGIIAWLAWNTGCTQGALDHARRGVEIAEKTGSPVFRAFAYQFLGVALVLTEEWSEAAAALEQALLIARETRTGLAVEATILTTLAAAYFGLGQNRRACATADESLAVACRSDSKLWECLAHLARARVRLRIEGAKASDDIQTALSQAQTLVEETGGRSQQPFIHEERAHLARLTGDDATHQCELREAHRLFTEMGATGHAERLAKELGL